MTMPVAIATQMSRNTLSDTQADGTTEVPVVSARTIGLSAGMTALILCLFLVGSLLVASMLLGSDLMAIGTFVGFSMMALIGMPLVLACVGDAIEHA